MSKKQIVSINGIQVEPGESETILLPMPKLYDWTPMHMPVHVIRGKRPGPTLLVDAAIHGDEVNGVEVIRRLLKKKGLKNIAGTLIAVPIVNVYGFLYQNRYLMDRRDLNRSFPGSSKGSLAARLAKLVMDELVVHATHIIDLHTGSLQRSNLPQIRADLSGRATKKMAIAFGAPVVLDARERDGSLRQAANERDIPFLLYEAGEALRFNEIAIRIGLQGVLNVMHHLEMLPLKISTKKKAVPCAITKSSYWVRAPHSGTIHPLKKLGARVSKDDILGIIANPMGIEEYKLKVPSPGIIIGQSNLPLVHEGAALFHIACFRELQQVADGINQAHDEAKQESEEGMIDDGFH